MSRADEREGLRLNNLETLSGKSLVEEMREFALAMPDDYGPLFGCDVVRMLDLVVRYREALEPEKLARLFHETYERLAPECGYVTRKDSAVPWEDVPAPNKRLMVAVAEVVARAALGDEQG